MLLNPLLSLITPLVGVIICMFFGQFFGRWGSILIGTGALISAGILA